MLIAPNGRPTRRTLALAALSVAPVARAETARRLEFDVWRGRSRIGRHSVAFSQSGERLIAEILAEISVSIGPITLFRYRHQGIEVWRGGRFVELTSQTLTNGRKEQLSAIAAADGVMVRSQRGTSRLAAGSLPLTHWNEKALASPLFNPETGAPFRLSVARQTDQRLTMAGRGAIEATRYTLSGEADLVDWYDAQSVWSALSAKASDGSRIDYRRVA